MSEIPKVVVDRTSQFAMLATIKKACRASHWIAFLIAATLVKDDKLTTVSEMIKQVLE